MSDNDKSIRLIKVAKELNIGTGTITEYLAKKGFNVENKPTAKLTDEMYQVLVKEFQVDKIIKEEAKQINIGKIRREEILIEDTPAPKNANTEFEQDEILIKNVSAPAFTEEPPVNKPEPKEPAKPEPTKPTEPAPPVEKSTPSVKVVGKINLDDLNTKTRPDKDKKVKEPEPKKQKPVVAQPQTPAPDPEIKEAPVVAAAETKTETETIPPPVEAEKAEVKKPEERSETIRAKADKLSGPNIVGKIDLPLPAQKKKQPVASSSGQHGDQQKRKRKRTETKPGQPHQGQRFGQGGQGGHGGGGGGQAQGGDRSRGPHSHGGHGAKRPGPDTRPKTPKEEIDDKAIQEQIKATLARLSGAGKSGKFAQRAKYRKQKRDDIASEVEEAMLEKELQSRILKVTEFVTVNELSKLMDVPVTQIISSCLSLGMFVSINQRLDAETLSIVAEEFGYQVEFVSAELQEQAEEDQDSPEDLIERAPIVTVMGHVDHGKTSLLDYVRKANVIAGEAGGITQHIGAYEVMLENGKKIAFLDTPGHEAFTAMRARGAKVTDIVIIVIAADDSVMPQTVEAINHAQAAAVPIVFAINKMDKEGANPDKIKEQLSQMNILVEEWGGKYQCQEISAKSGKNIDLLLEKVLLEAELLELKANPDKRATGTVIEAALDKGRGIITTVLIQAGTLQVGDPILAGCYSGRVKALFNERGNKVKEAGPSTPVLVLGMSGAPQAGDKFIAVESESEAREIANKRLQLQREQGIRTQKHITLDEIGRRLAIGNFKELNIIVKGDVDGSIEALSDSLLKLSSPEIQINVLHKSVGQISESDVLLASASDAIIVGFQVRPSPSARKLAEQEQIDIRLYSIIYDAINEIKAAMEGMLSPEIEEKIVGNLEIREVFKITKVGTVAGCMVLDGKLNRNTKVRLVRDGVVVYTGELASLKRFKEDVKEVSAGYECGLNIHNFNDIKVGDIIEGYENIEVKRKL